MASSNPAFTNSPAFSEKSGKAAELFQPAQTANLSATQLNELYGRPAATPSDTDRMTYEDTIVKTVVSFGILLVGAAVGWFIPVLALPAALVGFVLALVNIFKKKPSPPLILSYAAVQGVFVGGISGIFESMYPGIAVQAVLATLTVVGVTLALFASGKVRASKRATKIFLIAMVGYAAFSLINFGLMIFGANTEPFGLRSQEIFGIPLGLIIGVFVVLLAAYSLVLDFDNVQTGVRRGAPRIYGWSAAFGIMLTVIWLYLEIIRMIAILRSN
ncbi:Bax inhibitor-1/YccA family protein [Marisediminicola senii]|uniref:Bax inhibitor-1/YccA family protein n=1 Tax=Marisediminicola senii TaxID=2711233 RepID=UPI0013EA3997|nr:Bax inhibitor-1/YccA family protein [Marisediminicola senii]